MGQDGSETLVFQGHWRIGKRILQLLEECVHVRRRLGMAAVKVQRVAYDELHNRLREGVILKIFYYLCSRDSLQRRCKNAERVALRHTDARPSVIYADDSVHIAKVAIIMGKNNWSKVYRLSLLEDETHRSIRSFRFTRLGFIVTIITVFMVILGGLYCLIAFTPLRTTIPGYPDAHFRREAVNNAIKIDSLESAITRWKLYSENLSRVLSGDSTLNLDSLLQAKEAADSLEKR